MKLCLGTAQFGLDYGISNIHGKVPRSDVIKILNYAHQNNITMIDTASAYGDSEAVLGELLGETKEQFQIITKYPAKQTVSPFVWIDISLQRLQVKRVYGYLFHDYLVFQEHPGYIEDFIKIKICGKANKIGFSLYYPAEAEYILQNNIPCDIVQVPYNVFDQRFAKLFSDFKSRGIEIHIRSVFLQGLFFINPGKLDKQFAGIKYSLYELSGFAEKNQINMATLCMGFVWTNKNIDKIVIGVESFCNLKEDVHNYNKLPGLSIDYQQLESFSTIDENIILPFKWKKLR
jgi:aryl-alcohol dehydrogenase-like predicted oxidoreductase